MPIRQTLAAAQRATFAVLLPNAKLKGMPTPMGTGFFVSPDGWFVTAAHVVTENNQSNGPTRTDLAQAWLQKEQRRDFSGGELCNGVALAHIDASTDFALLKVDFTANARKEWLQGREGFPHVTVSRRDLDEGEPVYAFGYPLGAGKVVVDNPGITVGASTLRPRVTSAIVSSTLEEQGMIMSPGQARTYVLDKALNYGNSGGPILAEATGHVHAWWSRFQPVFIPQPHLKNANGEPLPIVMPSLYGVVSSFANPGVLRELEGRGVPIAND